MSAFANAMANVHRTLKSQAGVKIRYEQDGAAVTLTAIPGSTPVELYGPDNDAEISTRYADWLVAPEDLVLNGAETKPKRNAKITVTQTGHALKDATYRTAELPTQREVWRYSEEHGRAWLRIHSLLTSD